MTLNGSYAILPVLALAATLARGEASPWDATLSGSNAVESGVAPELFLSVTNRGDQPLACQVSFALPRNPQFQLPVPPDPTHGTDHARGQPSWLEVNGRRINDGSLTDGSPYTAHDEALAKPGYTEAFHFVDLGATRTITHLAFQSGDANWLWKMDVSSSADGRSFQTVPGLQGVDMHKRWGGQPIRVPAPFPARVLRLRYHKDGELLNFLRTPVALHVYDGLADESFALPAVGPQVATGACMFAVAPGALTALPLPKVPLLDSGAFLLIARVEAGGRRQLLSLPCFVMPAPIAKLPDDSPFGLNGSSFDYADINRRLGVNWMRFENMKWQMVMPGPDRYAFDGSVAPWRVNHDGYVRLYRERGIRVLPYTFQTPKWLSTAPAGTQKNIAGYPPRDNRDYGEVMFQLAARYGSKQHPDGALKTADRLSGLGLLNVFELWNEPNLEGAGWAPWVGSMAAYFELFRVGAEAVKRADPAARVSMAGMAGTELDTVAPFRHYTYADGKHPLDFTDLINVHYYSGQQNPEVATIDRNANRGGQANPNDPAYPEVLAQLIDWRDEVAPGKPIWLTETGNDVGGPIGLSERDQAAKVPRVALLALAAGIDKVFIYREKGSDPVQHGGAGLCRNDDSLRPVWFTYATLIRQFLGVKPGRAWRLAHPNPDVWLLAWDRGGELLLTAWAVQGAPALDLPLGLCTVVDAFGHAARADAAGLALGPFPVYLSQPAQRAPLDALLAAARKSEAVRLEARRRDAARQAYLFDFGSRDYVGAINLGGYRPFTPVLAADLYDAAKGYGFEPGAMRDGVAAWNPDKLSKDSTRINADQHFRFRVKPGRYRVSLLAQPLGPAAALALHCGGQQVDLPVAKEPAKAPNPVTRTVTLAAEDVTLSTDSYVELLALQLVAENAP
jgi:hypothetical protein